MKSFVTLAAIGALMAASLTLPAQTGQPAALNQTQQLAFAGLRSSASQGQFNAVQSDSSGNLFLLLDQNDGVRLLKTDNSALNVLAQAQLGAAGDIGLALALDPAGNVYITGTTTSTSLNATSGAAIPNRTDASTNSFVAKFDANLNPLFVTFTGGSRIAASALAATGDAVFVTGSLFAANLPVTPNGIQQSPAFGSSQNGFVEKFSSDGSTLLYATYLTGAQGNTAPTGIAADASDHAYIVGATTASGFPTIAALVPAILTSPSGFLTKLTPAGDGITFSTFISGPGLSSISLDPATQTLLLAGSIALGQFPIASVTAPIVPLQYQSVLRIPLDGSSVQQSVLLAPGAQSFVAPAASGAIWVDGNLSAQFLPGDSLATLGSGFAMRVNAQSLLDQVARFGGLPNANPAFASLPLTFTSLAIDPSGEPILAGSVQPTASSTLLASETYDLPLLNELSAALPSTLRQSETTASACQGSLCAGSAAYLAKLNPNASAPSLAFSVDDAPFLALRNLGSAEALNLQIAASGASFVSNCPSTLTPGGECDLLLAGPGSATVTASAVNATPQSVSVPAFPAASATIAFAPKVLDFGLQSGASPAGLRTLTITNLGATSQTFTSAIVIAPKATTPFSESSSDCPQAGALTSKLLAPGATCHITLALTAPTTPSSDGLLSAYWQIGSRDVLLTAYSQAAALAVSAPEIDFGTQYKAGLRLPRFLYLSNASTTPIPHATVALPAGSPFTLTDACPSTLLAQSVCGIRLDYLSQVFPSKDSILLALDEGLSVLITGQSLPQPGVGGSTVDPNLAVAPSSITFPNAVAVTATSGATPATVSITNTGASPFSLTLALTGDFTDQTSCASNLAAGQTCAVALAFAPSQPGLRQGLLAVTAGSGFSPAYVSLTGTGLAILPANNGTLDFGSSPIGQPVVQFFKVAQPFTSLTASATGPYSVLFIPDLGYGPGQPASTAYSASTSAACPSCFLAVRFDPTAAGTQPGTLTLTSDPAGNPYPLTLTGIGLPVAGLLLTPATQSFGTVPVNSSSAPILFTLTNATGAPATLTAPTVTGDFALNSAATGGQTCTGALANTASCLIQVDFAPTATGSRTGALTIASTSASVSAALVGSGTPDPGLALNPNALIFNNVPGPTATQQTITLANTGSSTLQIAGPTVATLNFSLQTTCSTLAPGAICTVTVAFTPGSAIAQDTLSIPVTATGPGGAVTSTTYSVPLLGNYTAASAGLQIVPGQTLFGPTPTSTLGDIRLFTLNNLTAKSLAIAFTVPRQFALLGPGCPTLAPTASCSFSVQFVPLTNANLTGSLVAQGFPSDGSAALSTIAYLDGFGAAQAGALTIASNVPGSLQGGVLNFGQVASGQTGSLTLTLSNQNPAGSLPITIRRVSSAPPFLSTTTCSGALDLGQSCTVTLNFAPTNQVAASTASPPSATNTGLLTLETDASSSPDLINLTGQAGPIFVANPVNGLPLAAFTLSQGSLTFPSTMVGDVSPPQTVTLTNTGDVILHVASALATPDFTVQSTCATLLAGATCALTVTSTPQTSGTHIAALEIASGSTTSLDFISLLAPASPSALAISPSSLDFGSLNVASTSVLTVHVTNISAAPIVFGAVTTSGDYAVTGTCPAPGASLLASQSCTLQVAFTPTQTGTRTGTLAIASSASTLPLTVALTGIGIQSKLKVAPSALDFGSLVVDASANLTLTLTNSGTSPIVNLAFTRTGDYAVTLPCPSTTLAAGASCALQVTFTPAALGSRPGTLTLTSSDPSSPLTIPLTGTGIPAGSFLLTVNGGSVASALAASGNTASYLLAITPEGYTGTIVLTCAAIVPGPYATCSLQPASVTLAGGVQNSIAILNTVTSITNTTARRTPISPILPFGPPVKSIAFAALLVCLRLRRRHRRVFPALLLLLSFAAFALIPQGCGSGSNPNLRYTPPGTYQYQVTASSTSGLQIAQSVTLNLTIP